MAKGLSSTQRTLRALREKGLICAIVEKWNPYAGEFGKRVDLFGFIDIIALDPQRGVIGIQSCGQSFSAHVKKILEDRSLEVIEWLKTPGTKLEIWGWRKVKLQRGGKALRWLPRVREIKLSDFNL